MEILKTALYFLMIRMSPFGYRRINLIRTLSAKKKKLEPLLFDNKTPNLREFMLDFNNQKSTIIDTKINVPYLTRDTILKRSKFFIEVYGCQV